MLYIVFPAFYFAERLYEELALYFQTPRKRRPERLLAGAADRVDGLLHLEVPLGSARHAVLFSHCHAAVLRVILVLVFK